MAAEAFGLIASILTVAGAAIDSSKKLYEAIQDFKNADKDLKEFGTEVNTVKKLLESLETALKKTTDNSTSESLRQCLRDFEPTMDGLSKLCDEARGRLMMSIGVPPAGRMAVPDKPKYLFREKAVLAYKYLMTSYKVTINIILGLVALMTSYHDRQVIEDLQNNITSALGKISGQIEGLHISLQSIGPLKDAADEFTMPNESDRVLYELGQCLKVSQSAVDAAPSKIKYSIERLDLFDNAHQFVSITEGTPGLVGSATARGQSKQTIIDQAFPSEFLMGLIPQVSGATQ
ncbi:hypothetical protein IQ07DRAFT_685786 [Pyrenochaeta sp. DS3sAY3a]|nr:hypothetical protein IQ07DRAFT_685786 [Pyrenochaeta sp. DS3sAY3a]